MTHLSVVCVLLYFVTTDVSARPATRMAVLVYFYVDGSVFFTGYFRYPVKIVDHYLQLLISEVAERVSIYGVFSQGLSRSD